MAKDNFELQQQQQQHHDDHKKHVDADGEHDQSRARTQSRAALHRVADAGKAKPDPKQLAQTADSKGYDSLQSGLLLLAKEMHRSKDEVSEAMQDDPQHNNQNGVATIERIAHMLSADAYNLSLAFLTVGNVNTMGTEVKTVWGAWFLCQPHLERALSWAKANGSAGGTTTADIDRSVKLMIDKLGARPEDLAQIRKEPEGDVDAMADKAFEDQLDAANAAVDSIEAGNGGDANRLKQLAQHIGVKAGYFNPGHSNAYHRHAKAVVKLKRRVDQLRTKDPSNQVLGEVAFQLGRKQ